MTKAKQENNRQLDSEYLLADDMWNRAIETQSNSAPEGLEQRAWEQIEQHERRKRQLIVRKWSIAASFALLLACGSVIYGVEHHKAEQARKLDVLSNALLTLSTSISTDEAPVIIYEDELITCYDSE